MRSRFFSGSSLRAASFLDSSLRGSSSFISSREDSRCKESVTLLRDWFVKSARSFREVEGPIWVRYSSSRVSFKGRSCFKATSSRWRSSIFRRRKLSWRGLSPARISGET